MNKTAEQYALNVQTLQQFEATFEAIKTEIKVQDPWTDMSSAMRECSKDLKPGAVVKATTLAWRGNNSLDTKLIVIGTAAGPLCLYPVTQGSSNGKPTIEERTFIQPHIPGGIYPLLNNRLGRPIGPEDLAWLVNPQIPEDDNIGVSLLHFTTNIIPTKPFKQTEF